MHVFAWKRSSEVNTTKLLKVFFIIFLLASVSFQTFPVNPYHSVSGKEDGFRYVPLGLSWYYSVPISLYIIKHLCSA